MTLRLIVFLWCTLVGFPAAALGQNATVNLPELVLNQLVAGMGVQSGSGAYQAAGTGSASGIVPWQWWVTDARFKLSAGSMMFTATVRSQVSGQAAAVTQAVPASVAFEPSASRLRINLSAFKVPLQAGGVTVTTVDVAKLFGLAVPVEPQAFALPLPGGGARSVTAKVTAVTAQFQPGRLLLSVSVGF